MKRWTWIGMVFTFLIARDRDIPGSPFSFFGFFPRTSYFCRLTRTSKGLCFLGVDFNPTRADRFFFDFFILAVIKKFCEDNVVLQKWSPNKNKRRGSRMFFLPQSLQFLCKIFFRIIQKKKFYSNNYFLIINL